MYVEGSGTVDVSLFNAEFSVVLLNFVIKRSDCQSCLRQIKKVWTRVIFLDLLPCNN